VCGVEERSRQAVLSWVTQISCFMHHLDITLNNYIFLPALISIVLAHGFNDKTFRIRKLVFNLLCIVLTVLDLNSACLPVFARSVLCWALPFMISKILRSCRETTQPRRVYSAIVSTYPSCAFPSHPPRIETFLGKSLARVLFPPSPFSEGYLLLLLLLLTSACTYIMSPSRNIHNRKDLEYL